MKQKLLRILIAVAIFPVVWIIAMQLLSEIIAFSQRKVRFGTIEGIPPVQNIRFRTGTNGKVTWATVHSMTNVPLSALVDLQIFGDFRPGLSFEECARRFGPPVSIGEPQSSEHPPAQWRDFTFANTAARIDLHQSISGGETNWSLTASPMKDSSVFAVTRELQTKVLDRLPECDSELTLWIYNGSYTELADYKLNASRIQSLRWKHTKRRP